MHDRTAGSLSPSDGLGGPGPAAPPAGLPRSAIAWAAFEGFRNPVIVLVSIYVFIPYFVSSVAPNPVAGQALMASAGQAAGWAVALTAPFLGVIVDRLGRAKPTQIALGLLLAPVVASVWFVRPGGPVGPWGVVAIVAGYTALFTWIELTHNTMLVGAAKGRIARTSGLGLALGNAVSVAALVLVLWAFALPGTVDWAFVPDAPLFGLNRATGEPQRVVGPIAALLLLAGLVVVAFGVPDSAPTGERVGAAARAAWRDVRAMLGAVRAEPNVFKFLVARMIYADGQNLIVGFAGVVAVALMGWGPLELLAFGIIMSVIAVIGGLLAGVLDDALGCKRAVQLEIGLAALFWLLLLSCGPTRIAGFALPAGTWWDGPVFARFGDLAYLGVSAVVAVVVTAAYASSRTMLTRLAPSAKLGSFFGLYILSGTATGWLGPLMLALMTAATQSQRGGFYAILILLVAGWIGMLFVRDARADLTTARAP